MGSVKKISYCPLISFAVTLSGVSSSSRISFPMATLNFPQLTKTLNPYFQSQLKTPTFLLPLSYPCPSTSPSFLPCSLAGQKSNHLARIPLVRAVGDGEQTSGRSSSNNNTREAINLPGCDYNHWLIVMDFPKDPAPTREQMIDTYLDTLATVLGRLFSVYSGLSSMFKYIYIYYVLKVFWLLFSVGCYLNYVLHYVVR